MRQRATAPLFTALALGPVLASGCGSSWDIRKGDQLPIGCAESYFYEDADGDKWGDPTSEPQKLCQADVELGLTASNGRDCDDADANITGLVGTSCPDGLVGTVDGAAVPHGGVIFDASEFAYVYGADAPVARHGAATQACAGWGGATYDGAAWQTTGTLATFAKLEEIDEVKTALEAAVAGGSGVHATFLGIEWSSASLDSGAWTWVDDSDDGLLTQGFSWCGGTEPVPADFFPLLNPESQEHVGAMIAQLPELRLAWVLQEDGNWCLGLPWQAIPADIWADLQAGTADLDDPVVADVSRYSTSDAHLLCERPKPNPDEYKHLVGAEE